MRLRLISLQLRSIAFQCFYFSSARYFHLKLLLTPKWTTSAFCYISLPHSYSERIIMSVSGILSSIKCYILFNQLRCVRCFYLTVFVGNSFFVLIFQIYAEKLIFFFKKKNVVATEKIEPRIITKKFHWTVCVSICGPVTYCRCV